MFQLLMTILMLQSSSVVIGTGAAKTDFRRCPKQSGPNLKYDASALARYGIEMRGIAHDTMLASRLQQRGRQTIWTAWLALCSIAVLRLNKCGQR